MSRKSLHLYLLWVPIAVVSFAGCSNEGDEIITRRLMLMNATADAMEEGDVQEYRRLTNETLELGKRWAAYCEITTESERRKLLEGYKDDMIAVHKRIEKAKPAFVREATDRSSGQ